MTISELVIAAAEAEWRAVVVEPGTAGFPSGAPRIDTYIRGPQGLHWSTCDVRTWRTGVPYTVNGQFAWCGAFAAFCYGAAGLSREAREKHIAGTGRLHAWALKTPRLVQPHDLAPGDIAVVGRAGSIDGEHIVIVRGVETGCVLTYEGNAHGRGPAGQWYEGVIAGSRPFEASDPKAYRVLYGVRPLASDFGA